MMRIVVLLFTLGASSAALAGDGIVFTQKTVDLSNNSTSTNTLHVEPERVAIDSDQQSRKMKIVYLAAEDVVRMYDYSAQTYRQIDRSQMEQVGAQMDQAMAAMQEQLKNMNPQQRAMVEKMMKGRMGAMAGAAAQPPAAKTVYSPTGESGSVNGRDCAYYAGQRDGRTVARVCAADWSDFDLRASDFAVFAKLSEMFGRMAPARSEAFRFGTDNWREDGGFPGVPVEQTLFSEDGKPKSKSTIESFDRQSIGDDVYRGPENFKMQQGFGPGD